MSSHLLKKLLKLSVDERLALADEIYASIDDEAADRVLTPDVVDENGDPVAMLPGQKAELERRIKKYEAHPELLIPYEEVMLPTQKAELARHIAAHEGDPWVAVPIERVLAKMKSQK